MKNILQISEVLTSLGIPVTDDTERIFSIAISLIGYIPKGSSIQTSFGTYDKVEDDILFINTNLSKKEILDTANKTNIIKIPV